MILVEVFMYGVYALLYGDAKLFMLAIVPWRK
jgi:hypothetical protein